MSEKILIIAPSWIGDCIMSQPLLRRLHELRGGCAIDVFAPAWSQAVFARMPEVSEIIDNPFGHGALRLRERLRVGRGLGRRGYTQVIVLPGSLKSALIAAATGIRRRTGYVGEQRYFFLNDIRKLDKNALPLMVDRYTALAHDAGAAFHGSGDAPRLQIDAESQAQSLLNLDLNQEKPILALCAGAEYGAAKRWPPRHFAAVARHFSQKGWAVWLFGSAKDAPASQQINELSGNICADLCGKTTLAQAADLLACADAAVCNDSGLMHLAAAAGCRVVAVYGSSSPQHTPPLGENAAVAALNLPCSPCFKRECPLGHLDCLEKLLPEQIIQLLERQR